MLRYVALVFWASVLPAVTVETTLLGTQTGPTPWTAGDALGNVYFLVPPVGGCSILQECLPFTLVKVDATGKVVFRKGLGDPAMRFQPVTLAADRDGNILIAGITADPGLPVMRPLQARPGGQGDVYLWQLSPDGARTLFASYLGGDGPEQPVSLEMDATGAAVLSLQTSANFPFTANEDVAGLPPGLPRLAVVRFSPATGRVAYALGLAPNQPPFFSIGPDGSVYSIAFPSAQGETPRVREIRPDGTRRMRPLALPAGVAPERVQPAADGSVWVSGRAIGALPTTPGALRSEPASYSYLRWEREQVITPPGPVRGLTVRQLVVDREDENRIYAATSQGFARSDDNGWTWVVVSENAALGNVLTLAAGADRLWALGFVPPPQFLGPPQARLLSSRDGGMTWNSVALPNNVVPSFAPLAFAAHPSKPGVLFLASGSSLLSTSNGGETWTVRAFEDTVTAVAVDGAALAVQTVRPQTSRFQPPASRLFWSDDDGVSFRPQRLEGQLVFNAMKFDPNEPGRLYFTDGISFARLAADAFPTVEVLANAGPNQPSTIQFGFQNGLPGAVFGMSADGRLQRSQDGGRTWTTLFAAANVFSFPIQMVVGAGGVAHVVTPVIPDGFLGKFNAAGEMVYLTYLGGKGVTNLTSLSRTPSGLIVAAGQTAGPEFPGERLGGTPNIVVPPGVTPPAIPAIFATAFRDDTAVAYSVALGSVGPTSLWWSGPGAGQTMSLVGVAFGDFPGAPPVTQPNFSGPSLFFTRLRP